MTRAKGIITDHGGRTSHAAIVSRELGVPCVVGTKTATKDFKEGDIVRVFGVYISKSLKGELIQDMSSLDIKLYRESFDKIKSLYYS